PVPPETIAGFRAMDEAACARMVLERQLAMDTRALMLCVQYFASIGRDPTETELTVIATYWSDHCRHTTFFTEITDVTCEDPVIADTLNMYKALRAEIHRDKPFTLMDVGTIAARVLKHRGGMDKLFDNGENNACTIRVTAETETGPQDWLLLFKNETHNHPTEIEPFGGAATCIGGAIRDPLSGGGYVFAAMRVTGGGDPTMPVNETLPGKLPQRSIAVGAAQGFASYGNQNGLATGQVKEYYHPGYVAKRLEAGAVMGAAPLDHVVRSVPAPGDQVILLGGRTGRDGCGGATGSSVAHTASSVDECAAQVQKGNAPEERKLQRLFRIPEAARMIKRCNDFGAGGVSVAIGELAPGVSVDLDRVPVKYEGLTATELAISESQERMAVVVAPGDVDAFIALAGSENLEATVVAEVTREPRLHMRWKGHTVVDIDRKFLDSNGARRATDVAIAPPENWQYAPEKGFRDELLALAGSLNGCSQRGLTERFDATVGAGSVLVPLGGRYQATPTGAIAHLLPVPGGTSTCAFMAHGFNPDISEKSPYHGAYLSVVESVANLVAAGADHRDAYLSFQEFFPRPGQDALRWGLPLAALLGALRAQMDLELAAIGGKDSMSGTFEHLDVPPTLISFAAAPGEQGQVRSPEWKAAGHQALWLRPNKGHDGLPTATSLHSVFDLARDLLADGTAISCCAVGRGGAAYTAARMALGNRIGFAFEPEHALDDLFAYDYGALILELKDGTGMPVACDDLSCLQLGHTQDAAELVLGEERLSLDALLAPYTQRLEGVYPVGAAAAGSAPELQIPTEKPALAGYAETNTPAPAGRPVADNSRPTGHPGTDHATLTGHPDVDSPAQAQHHVPAKKPVTTKHPGPAIAKPRVVIPVFPGTNCEWDTAQAFKTAGAEPQVLVLNNRTPGDVTASIEALASAIRQSQIVLLPGGFSGGDEPDGSGKFITAVLRCPPV
ncbi:MAG: phosphoribosylformylglycinamidine synthase, partial [Clostridiales bacterium]|nr:phosphoribosylformylglycinamidine synthase [Clostridiales bacterium]